MAGIFLSLNTTMQILCIGDGFGKGHVWPMWPQLLSQILEGVEVDNYSEVGAGNEFICNCILDACEKKKYDIVLVQWAKSKRLDIINNKQNNISKYIFDDKTYNTKYSNIRVNDRLWWLSSNSKIEYTRHYHKNYISEEQHKLRSINYIKLIELYLKQKQIPNFLFFSSYTLDFLNLSESHMLDRSLWCFYKETTGMEQYGKHRFPEYITNEVQPHPTIHLHYIKEILLPKLNITVDENKFQRLSDQIKKNYSSIITDNIE